MSTTTSDTGCPIQDVAQAELEELRRDRARLDWLDRNRGVWNAQTDSKAWHLSISGFPGTQSSLRTDIRGAIDAVMEASK